MQRFWVLVTVGIRQDKVLARKRALIEMVIEQPKKPSLQLDRLITHSFIQNSR
jgi:hypothetical protein